MTTHAPLRRDHVRQMAAYNRWMNDKVYAAAASLPATEVMADRGAFFSSIHGTLSHIAVADMIWLQRFAGHPAGYVALDPVRGLPIQRDLSARPFGDLAALTEHRRFLDGVIEAWADAVSEEDLDQVLAYANTRGEAFRKPYFFLVMHFFNHQTHHRGQVTTLLAQAGVDVGATDLSALIAEA
ncbi:DinB family protein [Dyella japonica]|uniref:Diguanylate cyclase n=1 Tax=Dyella japonica A8 TaxID=1217721 RepID=A0A075K5A1_9GAMM|nr:DinB family protein [Dyella japonica]AIF49401.1 diguanylate cyclase [Dyella japonica A8]